MGRDGRNDPRENDLDNLRSFLTALMIVHHTAIAYGGSGAWEFKSRCFPVVSPALTAFNAINQTFFMGLFFFLSGHFARRSIAQVSHNHRKFIRSRLLRLGLPAVLYTLIVEPALKAFVHLFDSSRTANVEWTYIGNIFWSYWRQLRGVRGPVWYLILTLVFDVLAGVIFRAKFTNLLATLPSLRRKASFIQIIWVANILVSFAVRLIYPISRTFTPLNLRLAFVPQYVLAYTWGHGSTLLNDRFIFAPLDAMAEPLTELFWSLCTSVMGLFTLFGISAHYSPSGIASFEQVLGGFNVPALLYAIWNEASFALIAPALMRVFAKYANHPIHMGSGPYLRKDTPRVLLARYSYAAYLSHVFVSLGVELAVEAVRECSSTQFTVGTAVLDGPVVTTLCVGLTNVLFSYFMGYLVVEYVPGARQII
jgi:glucans biosynthesis protein C